MFGGAARSTSVGSSPTVLASSSSRRTRTPRPAARATPRTAGCRWRRRARCRSGCRSSARRCAPGGGGSRTRGGRRRSPRSRSCRGGPGQRHDGAAKRRRLRRARSRDSRFDPAAKAVPHTRPAGRKRRDRDRRQRRGTRSACVGDRMDEKTGSTFADESRVAAMASAWRSCPNSLSTCGSRPARTGGRPLRTLHQRPVSHPPGDAYRFSMPQGNAGPPADEPTAIENDRPGRAPLRRRHIPRDRHGLACDDRAPP